MVELKFQLYTIKSSEPFDVVIACMPVFVKLLYIALKAT